MKKLILILLLSFSFGAFSQDCDIYEKDSVIWLGIDYTQTSFSHHRLRFLPDSVLVYVYIKSWNQVVFNEYEKFNINEFFYLQNVYTDFSQAMRYNSQIDTNNLIEEPSHVLSYENVSDITAKYGDGSDNIGLLIIAENYNMDASYYIVFLSMKDGEIIDVKKSFGRPVGGNLRNYWINSFYKMMKENKDYYKEIYKNCNN